MNKVLIFLLFFYVTDALSASSNAVTSSAATNAIITSTASIAAQQQQNADNQSTLNLANQSRSMSEIDGVMECSTDSIDIKGSGAWLHTTCKGYRNIKSFFEANKPSEGNEIISVYYDWRASKLVIYYK